MEKWRWRWKNPSRRDPFPCARARGDCLQRGLRATVTQAASAPSVVRALPLPLPAFSPRFRPGLSCRPTAALSAWPHGSPRPAARQLGACPYGAHGSGPRGGTPEACRLWRGRAGGAQPMSASSRCGLGSGTAAGPGPGSLADQQRCRAARLGRSRTATQQSGTLQPQLRRRRVALEGCVLQDGGITRAEGETHGRLATLPPHVRRPDAAGPRSTARCKVAYVRLSLAHLSRCVCHLGFCCQLRPVGPRLVTPGEPITIMVGAA